MISSTETLPGIPPSPPTDQPQAQEPRGITLEFLPNRRIRLTPILPELEQILIQTIKCNHIPEAVQTGKMFKRNGDSLETDLGFLPRIDHELTQLGVEINVINGVRRLIPQCNEQFLRNLSNGEKELLQELVESLVGNYLVLPEDYNVIQLLTALIGAFGKSRILITVPTKRRVLELISSLNFRLRDSQIAFESINGKLDVPRFATCTHSLLQMIPSDSTDILIVEDAHLLSGPRFRKSVKKFPTLKFGLTRKTENAREDKAMLLEGIFGPCLNLEDFLKQS